MQVQNINQTSELSEKDIQILVQAGYIPANTPPAQVQLFAVTCKQHNLSPFKKEIYLTAINTKNGVRYAAIVGIDGVRVKAQRTLQHAGVDDAKFNLQSDGTFLTAAQIKASGKPPITCTITAYRVVAGIRCPFTHTAVFSEFAGTGKWETMPLQMISKVAEMFALKKGFGDELSGLHIEEEMAAFEDKTVGAISVKPAPKKKDELNKDHEQWNNVVTALKMNTCNMDYVKNRFELSEANEALLKKEVDND
jgi:phage recombination protein Bet